MFFSGLEVVVGSCICENGAFICLLDDFPLFALDGSALLHLYQLQYTVAQGFDKPTRFNETHLEKYLRGVKKYLS